jgi:hypothetical protein
MIGVVKIDLGVDRNLKIVKYLMEVIRWKANLPSEPKTWILQVHHLLSDLLEKFWEKM